MYTVVLDKGVYKDLDKIQVNDVAKIYIAIAELAANPRPPGSQKLKGYSHRYRIRQGDYRILYVVDDAQKNVTVFLVKHRKDVYRE